MCFYVFVICFYLFLRVFICFYVFLCVFICFYMFCYVCLCAFMCFCMWFRTHFVHKSRGSVHNPCKKRVVPYKIRAKTGWFRTNSKFHTKHAWFRTKSIQKPRGSIQIMSTYDGVALFSVQIMSTHDGVALFSVQIMSTHDGVTLFSVQIISIHDPSKWSIVG